MSRSFEESMAALAAAMVRAGRQGSPASPFYLGEVLESGGGSLRVSCGGLQLEPEDLWLTPGLDYRWTLDTGGDSLLRQGDRVVLLSGDGQDYYLICKAVKA